MLETNGVAPRRDAAPKDEYSVNSQHARCRLDNPIIVCLILTICLAEDCQGVGDSSIEGPAGPSWDGMNQG
jgi:hypothetical protein